MLERMAKFDDDVSEMHRRRPGIRFFYSVAAIVGGVLLAIGSAGDAGSGAAGSWLFAGALALIVLGVISIPVFLWMDKRRL